MVKIAKFTNFNNTFQFEPLALISKLSSTGFPMLCMIISGLEENNMY